MKSKNLKAVAKERLVKEGWYDYEKGTEFKVTYVGKVLIGVEDFLGFRHFIRAELLELNEC